MLNHFLNSFKESNRSKHFFYAIPIGLVLTILCAIGVASGMEFKDKMYGNKWDWKDFGFTVLGGLIGQILQILLIIFVL